MDDTLSRGYVSLGRVTSSGEARFRADNHVSPPSDKHNKIYLSLVISGIGFLLPYNTFIIAADFYKDKYKGTTIVFDMSLVYILTALIAVLLNNVLVGIISLNTRITFGIFNQTKRIKN